MINVQFCKIIFPDTDNVSDQLPLKLPMELHVPLAETAVTIDQSKQVNVTYWIRQMNNKRCNTELDAVLCELPMYTPCQERDEHQTQTSIDGYMDCLKLRFHIRGMRHANVFLLNCRVLSMRD